MDIDGGNALSRLANGLLFLPPHTASDEEMTGMNKNAHHWSTITATAIDNVMATRTAGHVANTTAKLSKSFIDSTIVAVDPLPAGSDTLLGSDGAVDDDIAALAATVADMLFDDIGHIAPADDGSDTITWPVGNEAMTSAAADMALPSLACDLALSGSDPANMDVGLFNMLPVSVNVPACGIPAFNTGEAPTTAAVAETPNNICAAAETAAASAGSNPATKSRDGIDYVDQTKCDLLNEYKKASGIITIDPGRRDIIYAVNLDGKSMRYTSCEHERTVKVAKHKKVRQAVLAKHPKASAALNELGQHNFRTLDVGAVDSALRCWGKRVIPLIKYYGHAGPRTLNVRNHPTNNNSAGSGGAMAGGAVDGATANTIGDTTDDAADGAASDTASDAADDELLLGWFSRMTSSAADQTASEINSQDQYLGWLSRAASNAVSRATGNITNGMSGNMAGSTAGDSDSNKPLINLLNRASGSAADQATGTAPAVVIPPAELAEMLAADCSAWGEPLHMKLHLNSFVNRQKADVYLDRKIMSTLVNGKKKPLIVFGDWSGGSAKYHDPLRRGRALCQALIKRNYPLLLIDEFRTSKLHSLCDKEMIYPKEISRPRPPPKNGRTEAKQIKCHGLPACINEECSKGVQYRKEENAKKRMKRVKNGERMPVPPTSQQPKRQLNGYKKQLASAWERRNFKGQFRHVKYKLARRVRTRDVTKCPEGSNLCYVNRDYDAGVCMHIIVHAHSRGLPRPEQYDRPTAISKLPPKRKGRAGAPPTSTSSSANNNAGPNKRHRK